MTEQELLADMGRRMYARLEQLDQTMDAALEDSSHTMDAALKARAEEHSQAMDTKLGCIKADISRLQSDVSEWIACREEARSGVDALLAWANAYSESFPSPPPHTSGQ